MFDVFETQKQEIIKKQSEKRLNQDLILINLMKKKNFRKWIWNLLRKAEKCPYSSDSNWFYYMSGRMSILSDLNEVIRAIAPDYFVLMEKENKNDRRSTSNE